MKKQKLIPPDRKQCQAEQMSGSFMTLGPRHMVRCTNATFYIAHDRKPSADGLKGSMGLCKECAKVAKKQFADGIFLLNLRT